MVGSLLAWNSLLTYWEDPSMSRDVLEQPEAKAGFDSRIALLRRTFRPLLHLNVEKKRGSILCTVHWGAGYRVGVAPVAPCSSSP